MKLYKVLSQHISRYIHFKDIDPKRAFAIKQGIALLVREHLPSGAGIDCGTKMPVLACGPEKLVMHTEFHHMNEQGYTHWTQHTIYAKPSFVFEVKLGISGKNDNQIKDYLHDTYMQALTQDVGDFHTFPGELDATTPVPPSGGTDSPEKGTVNQ